jgi:hypothetical protein
MDMFSVRSHPWLHNEKPTITASSWWGSTPRLTDWPSVAMWLWLQVPANSFTRVEAGSNTSTETLRVVGGDEKGSLKSETVKYGRDSQGTRTRERLHWQGPGIYKGQTHPLVREGAPQKQDRNYQTVINIWSWATDGARHQDWLTERQSQCHFDFDFEVQFLLEDGIV